MSRSEMPFAFTFYSLFSIYKTFFKQLRMSICISLFEVIDSYFFGKALVNSFNLSSICGTSRLTLPTQVPLREKKLYNFNRNLPSMSWACNSTIPRNSNGKCCLCFQ